MSVSTATFTDVVRDVSGGNEKVPQSEFLAAGAIPVVDQGQSFIAGYTNDDGSQFRSAQLPVVVFGDHTKAVKFIDFPFAMGADGVKVLKPGDGCDTKYLYHFLRYIKLPDAGYSRHFKFVKELKIPLPPLDEQRRIATILDKADALRAKRRETFAKLDQLLQSVFLDMFGDPVTNPKNWPVRDLSEAADFITGHPFKSAAFLSPGEGIKLCRGTNVLPSSLDWTEEANWNREDIVRFERYRLSPGDVVVAMDRPWISSGFKIHLFSDDDPECLLVQRVARLRPSAHFKPNYLYTLFASDAFKRHCKPTETTIPHISPNDFRSFPVLDPGKSKIDHFECIASSVASHTKSLSQGLFIAERLFGSVQRKAFSGSSN